MKHLNEYIIEASEEYAYEVDDPDLGVSITICDTEEEAKKVCDDAIKNNPDDKYTIKKIKKSEVMKSDKSGE